ncbi:hypothetical protein ZWY2020_050275 [Hordeum vulgare]|nr:hypothetical protein ZWY2020_050275 [Hordeum vulgare]
MPHHDREAAAAGPSAASTSLRQRSWRGWTSSCRRTCGSRRAGSTTWAVALWRQSRPLAHRRSTVPSTSFCAGLMPEARAMLEYGVANPLWHDILSEQQHELLNRYADNVPPYQHNSQARRVF